MTDRRVARGLDQRPAEEHAEADAADRAERGHDDRLPPHHRPELARVWPTARSRPSSRVRSWTDSDSVLAMPIRAMTIASASRA